MQKKNLSMLALAGVMGASALTGCSSSSSTHHSSSTTTIADSSSSSQGSSASSKVPANKDFKSGYLQIPSLKINAQIYSDGDKNGVIDPVSHKVEWYNKLNSVLPGEVGNSVLAGHVTYNGPDVFYNLMHAKSGEKVITVVNGHQDTWIIDKVKSVDKNTLPHDQSVWGTNTKPELVLITCDVNSRMMNAHHHENNYVAWAHLAQ